ncbi:hypothetical protein A0H81_14568 [Grifola frondosa]|uniref:C2H2-type domain-containing protein n=1 Tax=Grifola frondosa TaxID=5627 RepID=A0A1C7LKX9_GRIFR|nr:hypothetical protein A0H81_14568 [Grifola frondosa]
MSRTRKAPQMSLPSIQELLPDEQFYGKAQVPSRTREGRQGLGRHTTNVVSSRSHDERQTGGPAMTRTPLSIYSGPSHSADIACSDRLPPTRHTPYVQAHEVSTRHDQPPLHSPGSQAPRRQHEAKNATLPPYPSLSPTTRLSRLHLSDTHATPTDSGHGRDYHDEKRHVCPICGKPFNRPSSLAIHLNSHTGVQREPISFLHYMRRGLRAPCPAFQCPYPGCSRKFSVNSNMRRHYRNHDFSTIPPIHLLPRNTAPFPDYLPDERDPYAYGSSPSSASYCSFDERSDGGTDEHAFGWSSGARTQRSNSCSESDPHSQSAPTRPRSCTVPGCVYTSGPTMLRPAFPQCATPM